MTKAEDHLRESLQIGWVTNTLLSVSHALVFLAELSLAKGYVKQGVTLLGFLRQYPAVEKRDRDEGLNILEMAKQHLSPRDITEALEESKTLKLEQIVNNFLEQEVE